ncbi:MAG: hypothetical protein HQL84_08755 [Magnetococcales bacterium]|nr:hypothetical protein [Magnetococcales bacterium]MBF0150120.1 hypothetical protein [Magnetococcales bacterium]
MVLGVTAAWDSGIAAVASDWGLAATRLVLGAVAWDSGIAAVASDWGLAATRLVLGAVAWDSGIAAVASDWGLAATRLVLGVAAEAVLGFAAGVLPGVAAVSVFEPVCVSVPGDAVDPGAAFAAEVGVIFGGVDATLATGGEGAATGLDGASSTVIAVPD